MLRDPTSLWSEHLFFLLVGQELGIHTVDMIQINRPMEE